MLKRNYHIKAVFFDFDGTLTQPGAIDFNSIKMALGCPLDQPVLEYIRSMEKAQDRRCAMAELDRFEVQGASRSMPNYGARRIIAWIKQQRLPMVIITRNSRASVMRSFENFKDVCADDFNIILTRDDPVAPKPSGDGIVWAASQLNIATHQVLMVGDFVFDLESGLAAGALTALIDPSPNNRFQTVACDFRIQHLDQLRPIIQAGLGFSE